MYTDLDINIKTKDVHIKNKQIKDIYEKNEKY
jgi:hypothetical protein